MSLLETEHEEYIGDVELIWMHLCFLLGKDKLTKHVHNQPRVNVDHKITGKPSGLTEIPSCILNELTEMTFM